MHRGTVQSFDPAVGLGVVVADGGEVYPFHCVAIADGSRAIAAGAAVRFEVVARLGRYEATAIEGR